MKQTIIWISALVIGALLGLVGINWIDETATFLANIYTRLFQLVAVPTIVLAVTTTLATLSSKGTGRIFAHTLSYTLLTTTAAAIVGALLYVTIAPENIPQSLLTEAEGSVEASAEVVKQEGYLGHILSVIPTNLVRPSLDGNVLSLLLLAFAIGLGLARLPESENKQAVMRLLLGLQELLFQLIHALIWALPLGIAAFAAQLSAQLSAGIIADSLGKYVLVVLFGNSLQFFIVLPLFLVARGLNPIKVLRAMSPAVLMALFTKSSAATLPITMQSAEQRLGVTPSIARFVLPICTTINMNGCAAFILVTSLFVMQQGGTPITLPTILLWILISVISAVGNAGVPMGCYFLTLSLMSGIGAPIAVLGLILPIYTIIDMIETAENVWSDSCVCAIVGRKQKDLPQK